MLRKHIALLVVAAAAALSALTFGVATASAHICGDGGHRCDYIYLDNGGVFICGVDHSGVVYHDEYGNGWKCEGESNLPLHMHYYFVSGY